MMHVQAATYTSRDQMLAAHKARQARFAAAARNVRQEPKVRPVALLTDKEQDKKPAGPPPLWSFTECRFEAHVLEYRRHQVDCFKTFGSPLRVYVQKRAMEFGLTYREITGNSRKRAIVQARQLVMYEIKTEVKPDVSLPEIGRIFGGKDHTTVLHAIRRVAEARARGE